MDIAKHIPKILIVGILIGGVGVIVNNVISGDGNAAVVDVSMPNTLSPVAQKGQKAFAANCAACHGENGSGSDKGPPLIHDIYNPGHHADEAFFRAAESGVQRHHWNFGNMPAQPQVSKKDVEDIVAFIREVQSRNGIHYKPHNM